MREKNHIAFCSRYEILNYTLNSMKYKLGNDQV